VLSRPRAAAWASVLLALVAGAPAAFAERLPIKSYTTLDGLASDRVECIVQDSHGFLWFCTRNGLSQFDGYSFKTFGPENGLPSPWVHALIETGEGEYWVGTEQGLCRFDALTSRCETQPLGDPGAAASPILALLVDAKNALWVGTASGLYRSDGDSRRQRFQRVALRRSEPSAIWALAKARDGSLWIAAEQGLVRILPDGRAVPYALALGRGGALAVFSDANGRVWVGSAGGAMALLPEPVSALSTEAELEVLPSAVSDACRRSLSSLAPGQVCAVLETTYPRDTGRAITQGSSGSLWIGTQNAGLIVVGRDSWTDVDTPAPAAPAPVGVESERRYSTEQGLTNRGVFALCEDRDGNLWIGTESHGVMKVAHHGLISYGQADGLGNTRIKSVFGDESGTVHASNAAGILHRFDGERFLPVRPNVKGNFTEPFLFGVRSALQDRSGDWWIPSARGVERFGRSDTIEDLGSAQATASYELGGPAGPLFEDSRGDVWLGVNAAAGASVVRWERATGALGAPLLADEKPPLRRAASFAEDRLGGLWVASDDGRLFRLREGRAERVALPGHALVDGTVALHVDRSGRLWIAAADNGLARIDHPECATPDVVHYGSSEGLASNTVFCIAEDRWGRLYLGTDFGVDRLDPETGRIRHYGTAEGLAASELTAAFADSAGRLWFGTYDGVSMLVPRLEPAAKPPGVHIAALHIAGASRQISALGQADVTGIELSPEEKQLEIEFAGIGMALGEELRYRYRLEGAESEWGPFRRSRSVNYARLSPGSYRFLVQAVNADGALSATTAAVAFRVLPPVWRRTWFLVAAGLLAVLLAHAAFRYRLRMLLEVERVRTGIATDLHDDIGSSLSHIAILSELARQGEPGPAGAASLVSIAELSRGVVDSMSDIVWAINPERDSLQDLTRRMRAFAGEIFEALDVTLRFDAPPDGRPLPIRANLRRQVFLVFKEAVTNAATHSACRAVDVALTVDEQGLTLQVADDGRGLDHSQPGDGHGLRSMAARARALGGALSVRSEAGLGTTVLLRVPLGGRRPWKSYMDR
jgi:ligand-binding sensor domain-containing protein/signal transduction histidine kinase